MTMTEFAMTTNSYDNKNIRPLIQVCYRAKHVQNIVNNNINIKISSDLLLSGKPIEFKPNWLDKGISIITCMTYILKDTEPKIHVIVLLYILITKWQTYDNIQDNHHDLTK